MSNRQLFSQLALHPKLLQGVAELSFKYATEVQAAVIPQVLAGNDLCVSAPTGTGKTAAFCLPILHQLIQTDGMNIADNGVATPRALILVPTRELAKQVYMCVEQYSQYCVCPTTVLYGGIAIEKDRLSHELALLIATPGRLLDHIQRGNISLAYLNYLVLDEADRLLDLGFKEELNRLIELMPVKKQSLLFSATLSPLIKSLSQQLLSQASIIQLEQSNIAAKQVEQQFFQVDNDKKLSLLRHIIGKSPQVLIFSRKKATVDRLVEQLSKVGIDSLSWHSSMTQIERERAVEQFVTGECGVLIATDVAARGIDISDLPLVINYELPYQTEDYIHRIGRTGRAGKRGVSLSFVGENDQHLLEALEDYLDHRIAMQWYPGFEPDLDKKSDSKKRQTRGSLKRRMKQRVARRAK